MLAADAEEKELCVRQAVTCLRAAQQCTVLGVAPTGEARKRLEEALTAIDTAESLGSSPDALNLNAKGNALGLLLQWSDARAAYEASGDAADRSFASIPRSNEALALFELGSLPEAEKVARKLIRRDPNFKDGFALLAALRYAQGDTGGAAALVVVAEQ